MSDWDEVEQSEMDYQAGYDMGFDDGEESLGQENDELRAELTEMYEELLHAYDDWEDVAEIRYSEGL